MMVSCDFPSQGSVESFCRSALSGQGPNKNLCGLSSQRHGGDMVSNPWGHLWSKTQYTRVFGCAGNPHTDKNGMRIPAKLGAYWTTPHINVLLYWMWLALLFGRCNRIEHTNQSNVDCSPPNIEAWQKRIFIVV